MMLTAGTVLMIGTIVSILAVACGALWRAASAITRLRVTTEDMRKDFEVHEQKEEVRREREYAALNARIDQLTAALSALQLEVARQGVQRGRDGSA